MCYPRIRLAPTLLQRKIEIMRKCSVTNHAAKGHTDYIDVFVIASFAGLPEKANATVREESLATV